MRSCSSDKGTGRGKREKEKKEGRKKKTRIRGKVERTGRLGKKGGLRR